MTTKIIVTDVASLKRAYGAKWRQIENAITRLIAADAARGIATILVPLDRQTPASSTAQKPQSFKAAIDAAFVQHNRPDYVMILGGPHVVPHQPLVNPLFSPDDNNAEVPSDLPYACSAPFSTAIEDFIAPSRVVGRLPDLPGMRDPELLVTLLDASAGAREFGDAGKTFFALSAEVWKRSTQSSLRALFGSSRTLHVSPDEAPPWSNTQLGARWHFVNCHGAPSDPQFYGQRGHSYPVAHRSSDLPAKIGAGTVLAVECCYGAELYKAATTPEPICVGYLREGAYGLVGSTTIAYGPATTNNHADLVCRSLLQGAREGASLGRALLQARQQYIQDSSPLSPIALKTIAQFLLLGDPSLHVVEGPKTGRRKAAPAAAAVPHAVTRGALASTADLLKRGVDAARSTGHVASPSRIRSRLEKEAASAGLVPKGATRAFGLVTAPDATARRVVARSSGKRVLPAGACFHVMFAEPAAPDRPKARSAGRGRGKAKGVTRDRAPHVEPSYARPDGVKSHAVLVAREEGGTVVVERFYAR